MEKTAREWFNEMPEPYRTLAIRNGEELGDLELEYSSLRLAIINGQSFVWRNTKEGANFWVALLKCIDTDKPVSEWPPVPNQPETTEPEQPTTEPDKYALFRLAIRPLQLHIGELASNALFDLAQMVLSNPDGGDIKQLSQILAKHNIK